MYNIGNVSAVTNPLLDVCCHPVFLTHGRAYPLLLIVTQGADAVGD